MNRRWLWISLAALGIGFLNFGIEVTDRLAGGKSGAYLLVLIYELTGVLTALVLVPFLLWLFTRFPLTRRDWWKRLPVFGVALVLFGVSHTTLMTLTRTLVLALLNLGPYQPGVLVYRYLMEFHKQVVIFGLVYLTYRFVQHLEETRAEAVAAAEVKEQLTRARLEALRLRLNPHFLFNTLNLISSRMYDDADVADRLLTGLSRLLRTGLADRQEVSLRDELDVLGTYLDIMKERFGTALDVRIEAEPQTLDLRFPSLILQPLVENSLKYGIERGQVSPLKLVVTAHRTGNRWWFWVRDNGPGLAADVPEGTGIGLASVRERLQTTYGSEQSFELVNRPGGGLEVGITVPCQAGGTARRWEER